MKVSYPVTVPFEALAHRCLNPSRFGSSIDQHPASGAQQTPRPTPDDSRSRKANERIDKAPAKRPSERQPGNRHKRGCGVRQNVNVSRPKIQILMPVIIVMLLTAQQPSADQIDH